MSESAYLAGVAGEIEWKGRRRQVALRDGDMEGLFSAWASAEALAHLMRCRPPGPGETAPNYTPPPNVWQAMVDRWAERSAFAYQWGMPAAEMARYSPGGVKYMLWLQLVKRDPAVTRELLDEMHRDDATRQRLEQFAVGTLDPNPPPPPSAGPQPPS